MKLRVSEIRLAGEIQRQDELKSDEVFSKHVDLATFHKPIKTVVRAQMTHSDIYVSGNVTSSVRYLCVRCLEQFEDPLNVTFSQTFDPQVEVIDLTDEIRDTVLVNLETKPLCKKNCQGLCPQCGQNRNLLHCDCEKKSGRLGSLLKKFLLY